LSSRLSDTGPVLKSLRAGSIFQTPLRFGVVWPFANPQAIMVDKNRMRDTYCFSSTNF